MKKTLDSGAVLQVDLAPFKIGNKLFKTVAKEIEAVKLTLNFKGEEGTSDNLNTWKNLLTRIISSDEVEDCLWKCCERALYNDLRITPELFESEKTREDYLVVMKEVLEVNLRPFILNLGSMFSQIVLSGMPSRGQ